MAVAVGSDIDPEAAFNSSDGSDIPVAVKVKGDSEGIADVLDKVRKQAGPAASFLGSDSDGDLTAIGPDADYRAAVLEDGGLGDTAEFQGVVREAEKASAVLFVNFDAGDWLVDLAGGDQEAVDNLEPLEGLGMSAWLDGRRPARRAATDHQLSRPRQLRPTRSVIASVIRTRSAGAISRSRPRRPADTNTDGWSSAVLSSTVGWGRR